MKVLTTMLMSLLLVMSAVFVAADNVVPVQIEGLEIDDIDIEPFGVNILDLERDDEFELEFKLESPEDADDVEIRAFISGYEYSDVEPVGDRIGPFDFDANVTYIRKMNLALPEDLDVDDYKLRVIVSNRNGGHESYEYDLQVNTKRHDVRIEDAVLSPNSVKAGQAFLATVRLENKGQKDEDDVRVTVSVPALGISDVDYIDEIENGDEEEETEELFLRVPKCAEAGVYDVTIEAQYNDRRSSTMETTQITVLEDGACSVPEVVVVEEPQVSTPVVEETSDASSKVRAALEVILLVLVALLVIVGLVIGFSRMKAE
jgi:hypothetical protein